MFSVCGGVEWGGCVEVCLELSLGAWDLERGGQGGWPPGVSMGAMSTLGHSSWSSL